MEQHSISAGMLDLIASPAFAVQDGKICHTNPAARGILISEGDDVMCLLETGKEEYASLGSGCLYLGLRVHDHPYGATVTRVDGFDVFVLESASASPALDAMGLAARELREPLSNLMIAADHMIQNQKENDTAVLQAQHMNRSLYQLLRLVINMSDAARYNSETMPRQSLQDIPALLQDIFDKASVLAAQTDIRLRFTNLDRSVVSLADPEKLERAVYNLLSNAMKFTPASGTVDMKLTQHGSKLHLTVCDSGCGIPDQLLGSIFTRHLRQACVESGLHGIGLGMVLIRAAALAHGGSVFIERAGSQGTKITMTLAIRQQLNGNLGSPRLKVDYAGELDHALTELADVLPPHAYPKN